MIARRLVRAAAVVLTSITVLSGPAVTASAAVPADPNAHGYIGLCDASGKNVTAGDVRNTPFVWKAVASQSPPANYVGRGQNTVLDIYQVRPGVDSTLWSGDDLTGTSFYLSAKYPAAQATQSDLSLSVITHEFPPMGDGYYELRMFFGKVGFDTYTASYPATFIRVRGNRWSMVQGGQVDCAAAQAKSVEVLVGKVPAASGPTASRYPVPAASSGSGWSSASLVGTVAVIAAAIAAVVGAATLRRRRRAAHVAETV